MKKLPFFFILIMLMFSALSFSFAQARITDIVGKVEIFTGGAWQAAQSGAVVPLGTQISTGFNSRAVVEAGPSRVEIRPLTRMSIAEYVESESTTSTSLDLRLGKVRANVKSAEGVTHNFSIKSPTSTASVRGTEFDYDGYSVNVTEGRVLLVYDDSGRPELVFEGEISGGETALQDLFDTDTNPDAGSALPPVTGAAEADALGNLVVTLQLQ